MSDMTTEETNRMAEAVALLEKAHEAMTRKMKSDEFCGFPFDEEMSKVIQEIEKLLGDL